MKNEMIRKMAKAKNVKLWEIADELGLSDGNFSRKLRKELSNEEQKHCAEIIEKISTNREE